MTTETRRPWHTWMVGVVILFTYSMGAWDFVKTMSADAEYLRASDFAAGAEAYFTDYPTSLMLLFAINVLCALAGGVAMLLRSSWAVGLSVTSAAAMLTLDAITFGLRGRWEALGSFVGFFDLGLLGLTIGFAGYCVWRRRAGGSRAPQARDRSGRHDRVTDDRRPEE